MTSISLVSAGTVSVENGGLVVTGTGTEWILQGIRPNDEIKMDDTGFVGWVASVEENGGVEEITLTEAWPHPTVSDVTYKIRPHDHVSRTAENNAKLRELLDQLSTGVYQRADAVGTLSGRDAYDNYVADADNPFVYAATDNAPRRDYYVKSGATASDWVGPFYSVGQQGERGVPGDKGLDAPVFSFTKAELEANDFGGNYPSVISVDGDNYTRELSGSPSLGDVDFVFNGSFDDDSGWGLSSTNTAIENNSLSLGAGGSALQTLNESLVDSETYQLSFEVKNYVSGGLEVRLLLPTNGPVVHGAPIASSDGVFTSYFTEASAAARLQVRDDGSNGDFDVDNISIRELRSIQSADGQWWTLGESSGSFVAKENNIAALRSIVGSDGDSIQIQQHTNYNLGGGIFYWDSSETDADDNGYIINPTGNSGAGRWVREKGWLCWTHYGVLGDNIADESAAVNAALARGRATRSTVWCLVTHIGIVRLENPIFYGDQTDVYIGGHVLFNTINTNVWESADPNEFSNNVRLYGGRYRGEDHNAVANTNHVCFNINKVQRGDFGHFSIERGFTEPVRIVGDPAVNSNGQTIFGCILLNFDGIRINKLGWNLNNNYNTRPLVYIGSTSETQGTPDGVTFTGCEFYGELKFRQEFFDGAGDDTTPYTFVSNSILQYESHVFVEVSGHTLDPADYTVTGIGTTSITVTPNVVIPSGTNNVKIKHNAPNVPICVDVPLAQGVTFTGCYIGGGETGYYFGDRRCTVVGGYGQIMHQFVQFASGSSQNYVAPGIAMTDSTIERLFTDAGEDNQFWPLYKKSSQANDRLTADAANFTGGNYNDLGLKVTVPTSRGHPFDVKIRGIMRTKDVTNTGFASVFLRVEKYIDGVKVENLTNPIQYQHYGIREGEVNIECGFDDDLQGRDVEIRLVGHPQVADDEIRMLTGSIIDVRMRKPDEAEPIT